MQITTKIQYKITTNGFKSTPMRKTNKSSVKRGLTETYHAQIITVFNGYTLFCLTLSYFFSTNK